MLGYTHPKTTKPLLIIGPQKLESIEAHHGMSMTEKNKRTQYDLMNPLFDAMKKHKLPSTQRLFILGLYRYMDGNGKAYPSYQDLMDETGLSRQSIINMIRTLTEAGWITYKQGSKSKQMNNTYWLNLEKLGIQKAEIKTLMAVNE